MTRALFGVAIILFAGADDRKPSAEDLMRNGLAAWNIGDFQTAAVWYERAVALAPDSPEPAYNMALTYYRQGFYEQSLRYLDKTGAAHGELLARCLLLRADIEYRGALAEKPARQVEGLERALSLYRAAQGTIGASAATVGIARYDIEVVKLRLPVIRSQAPGVTSGEDSEQDESTDAAARAGDQASKNHNAPRQEDRDW